MNDERRMAKRPRQAETKTPPPPPATPRNYREHLLPFAIVLGKLPQALRRGREGQELLQAGGRRRPSPLRLTSELVVLLMYGDSYTTDARGGSKVPL